MPDDRDPRYIDLVHDYDQKPRRRLFELLKGQGLQANQDVTFLTDGGEEVRALTELVTPEAEHVLDWFHIAMRLTVLEQYARGVAHHNAHEGARLLRTLERINWPLWHGNGHRARQQADDLRDDAKGLELDYPHLGKFARSAAGVCRLHHVERRQPHQLWRAVPVGERISSAMAESTVNAVVSKRSPSGSRCSGPGGTPTCCCKPHPRPRWHAPALVRAVVSGAGKRQSIQCRSSTGGVNTTHFLMVPSDMRAGDMLVVWKLDRLGRSLSHLIRIVEELKQRGAAFVR